MAKLALIRAVNERHRKLDIIDKRLNTLNKEIAKIKKLAKKYNIILNVTIDSLDNYSIKINRN